MICILLCGETTLVVPKSFGVGGKIKIDKEELLSEAKEYYGRGGISDQSYFFAEECIDLGQEWLDTYKSNYWVLIRQSQRAMKKGMRNYLKERVNYKKYNGYTFVPTFVWVWIANTIISWVVKKIIVYIIKKYSIK